LIDTPIAYILYFHLIQTAGASKALTVTYLVPLFAMAWAFIFLSKPFTPAMIFVARSRCPCGIGKLQAVP